MECELSVDRLGRGSRNSRWASWPPSKPASPILYPSQLIATPLKSLRLPPWSHPPHALTTARLTHQQIPLPSKQISSVTASHHLHGHPSVKACRPLLSYRRSLLADPPASSQTLLLPPLSLCCLFHKETRAIFTRHKYDQVIFLHEILQRLPPHLE